MSNQYINPCKCVAPLATLLFLPIFFHMAWGQSYFGFEHENYSGVNSVIGNPANIADSRFTFDMNLIGISTLFSNDAYAAGTLSELREEDFDFPDDLITSYSNENSGYLYTDILGPSIMFNINRKNTIALTTRLRAISNSVVNGNDLDQFVNDFDETTDDFTLNQPNTLSSVHAWGEVGLSYARVIKDDGQHFLKAGATLKYLVGLARGYVQTDNLVVNYLANGQDFDQNLADGNIEASGGFAYGTSIQDFDDFEREDLELPKSLGFDLGVVYEWRPDYDTYYITNKKGEKVLDPSKNKYKIRIGLSITDIGAITYNEGSENTASINGTALDFVGDLSNASDFDEIQTILNDPAYTDLINDTANALDFADLVDEVENATTLEEVEAIVDANSDDLIESLENIDDLDDAEALLQSFNIITIDSTSGIKASLPTAIRLNADYSFNKNLFLNLATSVSLTSRTNFKTNALASEIALTPRYESRIFSFYSPIRLMQNAGLLWGAGLRFGPLYLGSGSLLSNVLGSSIQGGDIYAGLKVPVLRPLIKDMDGDGIKDKKDGCPTEAGPKENKGCPWPDTDGDGVLDKDDACVDESGELENKGCPWPDTDNDSVYDKDDACVETAGPIENQGCPWPDTDGDGVMDKDDACVNESGSFENKGCPWPDTDNDGVYDKDDACPTVAGTIAMNGCPEVSEEVQKELNSFAKTILFNSGKSSIKSESSSVLTEIVAILQEYPNANFVIEGHTDSIGSATTNQSLSEKRAAAVLQFLVDNGVATDRLTAIGYGETKPIATNMYKDGRKQNRRVEINLVK